MSKGEFQNRKGQRERKADWMHIYWGFDCFCLVKILLSPRIWSMKNGKRQTIVYLLHDYRTINTLAPLALMQFAISPSILITLSCQLDTTYSDSKESSLRDCPSHIVLWECLWSIVIIANRCRRAQPTVSRTIPNQLVLDYIKKVPETMSEPISRAPPWCLSRFLI